MLFDNQEVLVLLAKSIDKVLTHSLEMVTCSKSGEKHHFEADCIVTVLETLLWFAKYSPQTSQVTVKLMTKSRAQLQALLSMPEFEEIWG